MAALLNQIARAVRALLRPARSRTPSGAALTREITPTRSTQVHISYAPSTDGAADAGEIVWTWVPYAEKDGRGKDRPVLVIGKHGQDRVYAVKLTSKARDGQRDYLAIGAGPWDSQRRPSWVDLDQLYSVPEHGLRREACALDLDRFVVVANELHKRYGWTVGN